VIAVTLASASVSRAAILRGAGVVFDVAAAGVDEAAVKADALSRGADALSIAASLAELKAMAVPRGRTALVIGADQTLELDGLLFDKPGSAIEARSHLERLRGRTHALHAAVAVARDSQIIWQSADTARLTMRAFSDLFLDDYLARLGAAATSTVGAYRLEGEGAQLFERIEGDYFSILGLPLLGLLEVLRREGALAR
jgi:septum formation protein